MWHGARERYVYETVLAGRDLGTPELYGLVWDEPSGRHWLLLEFVQGRTLRQSPIEDWVAAAGWLGRLHGALGGREAELARPGLLVNYDDAYFRNMAERALRAVGSRSGSLHRRLAAAVDAYWAMIEGFCEVDHRPTIERFCEAYAEGADAFGLEVTCSDELLAELDRLRLHRVLRSLARSAEWAYPDSAVTILVDKAETIRRGLA